MRARHPEDYKAIRGRIYWVVVAAMIFLLVVDLAGDGPQWGNVGVLVLVAASVLLRPGGIRGPRRT